jgi:glycosyltransferase involved in cell wall biosynthesis
MGPAAVTAVVTTRNRLAMLRRTLGSILDQRGAEVAVVVVDEGSTDGTTEFLAGVAHPRLTVVRNDPPLGLPAARNQGIDLAATEWVAICDDDDVWAPTKIRDQLGAVAALPGARWAVAGTVLVDDDLQVIGYRDLEGGGETLSKLLTNNVVPSVSGLFLQRSLWEEVGRFDPELRASEDWDFEIRMAEASPMAAVNGPYVGYRVAAGSMSNDTDRMRASFDTVRARYGHLAREHGVEFDAVGYEEYIAHHEVKARRRLAAARCYARLASWRRQPRDLVRATASLVAPGWTDEKGQRNATSRVPEAWRRDAERWLRELPLLSATDGRPTPP